MLWVALHFPGLQTGLEPLAAWACQFTPRVALEPPDALVAEVEGSLRYFGGRGALLAALQAGGAALGLQAWFATAPTARAALWRVRGGGLPPEELPIGGFGAGEAFCAPIGIATPGGPLRLPRPGPPPRRGEPL